MWLMPVGFRPIGPGGYSGGECYRTLVEVLLAGGDFLSDRRLLEGATERLRGEHAFPSHTTLFRFLADADLGRAQKAAAVNRTMLARAWAMGAGPDGGLITIDPDATLVDTYGGGKEGSAFSYRGETGLSPLIGVCGETGDVLALRARGGSAHPGRALAGFVKECAAAIPAAARQDKTLWVRIDSAGYQHDVFAVCESIGAVFCITAPNKSNVRATVLALATDPGHRVVAGAGRRSRTSQRPSSRSAGPAATNARAGCVSSCAVSAPARASSWPSTIWTGGGSTPS
jgi:hypothetical protein